MPMEGRGFRGIYYTLLRRSESLEPFEYGRIFAP